MLCGSITLERAVDGFPPGTVHLAVIDPGVGTDRRLLVTRLNGQTIVCPDNGLITWPWHRLGPGQAYRAHLAAPQSSDTFHGRDIMAPAAGMLAAGRPLADLARPIDDPDPAPGRAGIEAARRRSRVIHIDHFGNATTNLTRDALDGARSSHGPRPRPRRRQGPPHLLGRPPRQAAGPDRQQRTAGIAVRDGSAAEELGLKVGDEVVVE